MGFYLLNAGIFLTAFFSGLVPLLVNRVRSYISLAVSFAGGVLIGVALFHLLPESVSLSGNSAGLAILAGFAVFYIPQKFVVTQPCEVESVSIRKLGILSFIGITFHSFTDGISLGAAYSSDDTGVVGVALVAHKIPASVALTLLLQGAGVSRRNGLVYLALFSFSTPLGAIITHFFIESSLPVFLGYALGFSAGNFLAIAFGDLFRKLYQHEKSNRLLEVVLFTAGAAIVYLPEL